MPNFGRGLTGINSGIIDANGYVGVTNETEPQFKLSKTNATARTGIIKLITDYLKIIYNGIEAIWIDTLGNVNIRQNLTVNGTTIYSGGVTYTDTTDSTSKDTGSIITDGGIGIEKNLYVGASINAGSSISSVTTGTIGTTLLVNGTTQSADKDTGAIVTEGGLGVEKNINAGGNIVAGGNIISTGSINSTTSLNAGTILQVNGTTDSTTKDTGALIVEGGAGIEKSIYAGGSINAGTNVSTGANLIVNGTTDSTSKDTGSIITEGGVGIEKSLFVGASIDATNNITSGGTVTSSIVQVTSSTDATSKDTGALIIQNGGLGVEKALYVGTNVSIGTTLQVNSTTDSVSKDTGAIVTEGGVGIEKALYVGTNANIVNASEPMLRLIKTDATQREAKILLIFDVMRIFYNNVIVFEINTVGDVLLQSTTDSTSKNTGSLVIDGGMGIEKSLYVGANVNIVNTSNPYLYLNKTDATAREAKIQLTGDLFNITHNAIDSINIDTSGDVGIGTNAPTSRLYVKKSANNEILSVFENSDGTNPYGIDILFTGAAPNNTTNYFIGCSDNSQLRFFVYSNGNVANFNNSYGAISDISLKENITDATPKLDDIMKVKIRNYNLIGDDKKQIGVVAQELEQVFPSMVDETTIKKKVNNDDGTIDEIDETIKSVKYSVFVPMLIKSVQEQQSLINDLKTLVEIQKNTIDEIKIEIDNLKSKVGMT